MVSCTSDDPSKTPDEQLHENLGDFMNQLLISGSPTNGCFKREFLLAFRNVQKIFAGIQCPLSPEEVKELGLVKDRRRNRGRDFYRTKDGILLSKKDREKFEKTPAQKEVTMIRGDMEKLKEFKKIYKNQEMCLPPASPNAWKPSRQRCTLDNFDEDAAFNKTYEEVRALLNKVTPTTKKHFINQFLSFNLLSDEKLPTRIAEMLINKGIAEPQYCSIYGEILKAKIDQDLISHDGKSLLKNEILKQTQAICTSDGGIGRYLVPLEEYQKKQWEDTEESRKRRLGVITFVGHLDRNEHMSVRIAQACIYSFFKSAYAVSSSDNPPHSWKREDIDQERLFLGLHFIGIIRRRRGSINHKVYVDLVLEKLEQVKIIMTKKNLFMFEDLKNMKERRRNQKTLEPKVIRNGILLNKKAREKFEKTNAQKEVTMCRGDMEKLKELREIYKDQEMCLPPASPNAWKPSRQRNALDISEEDAVFNKTCEVVRALLNKVTATTKKHFTDLFLSLNLPSDGKLSTRIAEIMINKAIADPQYSSIYVEIFKAKIDQEVILNNGRSRFRNGILTQLQVKCTENGIIVMQQNQKKQLEDSEEANQRRLGIVTLVGHLHLNKIITTRIIQRLGDELLKSVYSVARIDSPQHTQNKEDINQERLRLGLRLIGIIGSSPCSLHNKEYVGQVFEKLEQVKTLMTKKNLFMFEDLKSMKESRRNQKKLELKVIKNRRCQLYKEKKTMKGGRKEKTP